MANKQSSEKLMKEFQQTSQGLSAVDLTGGLGS